MSKESHGAQERHDESTCQKLSAAHEVERGKAERSLARRALVNW